MGTWNESYQGSLTEEECIAKREWFPAKQSRPESCSENYWSNKEDCESKSEWILKKESIPGFCQDNNSLSKDDCLESNWIEEVPEVEAYCLDGISKSLYLNCKKIIIVDIKPPSNPPTKPIKTPCKIKIRARSILVIP